MEVTDSTPALWEVATMDTDTATYGRPGQQAMQRRIGLGRVREIQAHAKIARWADQQVARNASHDRALDRYLALSNGGDWPEDH